MKNQARPYPQQYPPKAKGTENTENLSSNKPVKSPSPDRQSSNSITYTRSPLMREIKKQITPIKEEPTAIKILQKIENREKLVSADVTPKNYKDLQQYEEVHRNSQGIGSHGQPRKYEEDATIKQENKSKYQEPSTSYKPPKSEDSPSEFQIRYSSRLKENYQSKTGELDYLRLLKEKEETIKELRDLLELIEKSNSGQYEEDERVKLLERKLKEYSKQVKVLEIENQCLISVIENNHVNIPSNKEEILQREIRELRESLSIAEQMSSEEASNLKKRIEHLESENKKLENECQRLLKIMKERDAEKKETPSFNSHPLLIKDKERTTLTKIREQYNQNLKLAKENFENQYQDCYESFAKIIEKEGRKLDYMALRVQQLQLALKQKKPQVKSKPIEPKDHQQIQSLLFQKYSKYMKELDQEKKVNQKLNLQLSIAWKSLRQLEMKSFNSSQEMMNESQSQEISELSHRNTHLKNRIKELEAGNYVLKKTIEEVSELRLKDIQKFEEKLQIAITASEAKLKEQREIYQKKCKEYEVLKHQMVQKQQKQQLQQSQKQTLIEQKITQIIHTYEKQADIYKENLLQRARMIESLQEENGILRNQIENHMNLKEKETDISKFSESERMLESLENEIKQYKDRLNDCNYFISKLEESNTGLERDNDALRKSIEEIKQNSHVQLEKVLKENKKKQQELAYRVENSNNLQQQNSRLLIQIQLKNKEILNLKEKLDLFQRQSKEISNYISQMKILNINANNDESFEEQLKGLKKSIVQFFAKYKEQTGGKLLENYYTIETLYQAKIDENLKLHEELQSQKDCIARQQRQKLRLLEKVTNLQKNIGIYQQELKQRKLLYEGLLKQKSRMEKQVILTRKIKDFQVFDESKSNVSEITKQIDNLVQIQRTRRKNIIRLLLQQKQTSI